MNKTMLSVVALAVGAVLIIGLYNIYKPQTKSLVTKTFRKVHSPLRHLDDPPKGTPVTNIVEYDYKGKDAGFDYNNKPFTPKGKFGEQNHVQWWGDWGTNEVPGGWIPAFDGSEKFSFGQNNTVQHVDVVPSGAITNTTVNYVEDGHVKGSHDFRGFILPDPHNRIDKSNQWTNRHSVTIDSNSKGVPSGYKVTHGVTFDENSNNTYNVQIAPK